MRLDEHIQSGDEFKDLWVEGEVSQARVSPAGHVYFTLRDNVGQLQCVLFASQAAQIALDEAQLGDAVSYLTDGMTALLSEYEGDPIGVELPASVVLTVTETDLGLKGDTATGATKPATLETGLRVSVPLFVERGDKIRVDTRTGEYLERA